jgi:hypothetical protein
VYTGDGAALQRWIEQAPAGVEGSESPVVQSAANIAIAAAQNNQTANLKGTMAGGLRSRGRTMARNKRIFIAFAIEDKFARDNLVYQASRQRSAPFDFTDMSVKQPWDQKWKTNCRSHLQGCDGVIAFISRNTPKAEGACWEIRCAKEERIPIKGFWVHRDDPCCKPAELGSTAVVYWTWDNIINFLDSL